MQGLKLFSNSNKFPRNEAKAIRKILPLVLLALILCPPRVKAVETHDAARFPVGFEGQQALTEPSLRQAANAEISRFYQHDHRRADADDAAFQMEQLYRCSGFAFAAVHYRYATVLGKPGLLFTIVEGPVVKLEAIRLRGNSTYAESMLQPFYPGQHKGPLGFGRIVFNRSVIDSGASALRDFYLSEGFLEVKLDPPQYDFSPDQRRVIVTQVIHEGIHYVIRGVEYAGDLLAKLSPDMSGIKHDFIGKPYYRRQALALSDQLLQLYGDKGYVDATVTVDAKLNSATGQAVLYACILSGLPITLTRVDVIGNTVTQSSFIISRLPLIPGQPLRLSQKSQGFSNLYATGLFSKVDLSLEKTANPREKILQVMVDELPFKEFYVEAGYGSYEWFRLLAGFKEKNVFGTGRIFRTEAGASFKGEDALVGLTDPWFLNTEITGDLSVFYHRRKEPEAISQDYGSTVLFTKKFFEHGFLSLGYTLLSTHLLDVQADVDLKGAATDYPTGAIILQTYFDTRNNVLYPSAGQKVSFSSEFSNPDFGGQMAYSRFTFGAQGYLAVTGSSVLALRYDTGLIIPGEGLDAIPLNLRFYNGGGNSVRSFQEHALGPVDPQGEHTGGLASNVLNLEWRQHLAGDMGINFFFDTGNVAPNRSREQAGVPLYATRAELIQAVFSDYFTDFRSALGVGLEYLLPIGPARLDFGLNPSPSSARKEALYTIHFSVGMVF
jgi:outer membrane protein assembly complex protein YaeT